MIIVAVEGVGGSGKSTVINELEQRLSKRHARVTVWKVGGIGESSREQQLKKLMTYREELLLRGGASPKQLLDKAQDRIFRLAIRHQVRRLRVFLKDSSPDIVLLDRTPFMSWVYSAARDPSNPYLREIWEEAVQICLSLHLQRVFLLEVAETTAFARIVARVAIENHVTPEEICDETLAKELEGPLKQVVLQKASALVSTGVATGKPYSRWDFVPWSIMVKECQLYRQIFSGSQQRAPIPASVIDGEGPFLHTISVIEESIARMREKTGSSP